MEAGREAGSPEAIRPRQLLKYNNEQLINKYLL